MRLRQGYRLQQTACRNCSGCWCNIVKMGGRGEAVWMWWCGLEQEMCDASSQNKNINRSLKNMLHNWCTGKRFDCKNIFTVKNMKHFSIECSRVSEKALFCLKFPGICPLVLLTRVVFWWAFVEWKTLIKKYSEKSPSHYKFDNYKSRKAGLRWNPVFED